MPIWFKSVLVATSMVTCAAIVLSMGFGSRAATFFRGRTGAD